MIQEHRYIIQAFTESLSAMVPAEPFPQAKTAVQQLGCSVFFCRLHYGADTQVFYFPNRLRPLELFFLSLDRAGNQSLDKELLAKEEYQEHRYNAQAARCHGQVIFGALFVNKLVHSYR